tara:strand:+ start:920 stop:1243 length:324 start_codon:yes stop_codon:yes gene_type:complete
MNMTQKQMEQLADMVASKIVLELFGDADARAKAKRDFEDQFISEEKPIDHLAGIFADMTDEEMLIGELARLQTILMIYESQDTTAGYEKAARVLKKLKQIQRKLGKL